MERKTPVSLPEGYVDFFKELENWQNTQQINLKRDTTVERVPLLMLLANHHKPLLRIQPLDIDELRYRSLTEDLTQLIESARPETHESMEKLRQNIGQINFKEIPEQLLNGQDEYFSELAESISISVDLLVFVLDHTLRPFLRLAAEPYNADLELDEFQSWDFPTICPICGSRPHISRLRSQDGRRYMYCERCFTEWEARFLQCVHCGDAEPGDIKYLTIENDDAYQLYICEKCHGYLKTFDERVSGRSTDLFIANIETVYLDMLAREKGYTNHDS